MGEQEGSTSAVKNFEIFRHRCCSHLAVLHANCFSSCKKKILRTAFFVSVLAVTSHSSELDVPSHPSRVRLPSDSSSFCSRKELFQPHLPVRLPCYDLAPITSFTLGRSLRSQTSDTPGFHGLTGGVYKARERIHRAMADARLLANPASWSRVADSNPNWEKV